MGRMAKFMNRGSLNLVGPSDLAVYMDKILKGSCATMEGH